MQYTCPTYYKTISEPEPHFLQELEEARGYPDDVYLKDGLCIAKFSWGLVAFPQELEERLRELVGRKCAILRIDGQFHIRELESGHA